MNEIKKSVSLCMLCIFSALVLQSFIASLQMINLHGPGLMPRNLKEPVLMTWVQLNVIVTKLTVLMDNQLLLFFPGIGVWF